MRKGFIAAVGGLLFLAVLILVDLAGDWGRLGQGIDNLLTFTGESMWPPNWSVLEARSYPCLLYTSPSPRDMRRSRMPSSA